MNKINTKHIKDLTQINLEEITFRKDDNKILLLINNKPIFFCIEDLIITKITDNEIILKLQDSIAKKIMDIENLFIDYIEQNREQIGIKADVFKSFIKIMTQDDNEFYIIKINKIYEVYQDIINYESSVSIIFQLACIWNYDNSTGLYYKPLYVKKN
ncbi:hypothetical protein Hokovirus_3_169 [Hokovirus HKV1]|uniref:Uncharacterized protein n=1 Tax=Hokovirus HKV1 TaxID=1977638 RepID=A0A1V0SGP1_9VIRU|nr:hypothetical protein Hokovirus_3_169 [Hokovirus HKV1]